MKAIGIVAGILVAAGAAFLTLNRSEEVPEGVNAAEAVSVKQVVLPVEGMTCSSCAISVKMALKDLEGVRDTQVDVEKGQAAVTYVEGKVTVDQMIRAINSTGFTARRPDAG